MLITSLVFFAFCFEAVHFILQVSPRFFESFDFFKGLMKRGMNGVRKSGEEVRPISKVLVSRPGNGRTSAG